MTTETKAPSSIKEMDEKVNKLIAGVEEENLKLKLALAKIGTLTGYGNHLKEFGIEMWTPGAKDLKKKVTG